jgi:hypothetical protein
MEDLRQVRFSLLSVIYAIEEMVERGETHLFYSNIVDGDWLQTPGILRKHLLLVVMKLQEEYRGQFVISRTPGGLVVDGILSPPLINGS